MTLRSNIASWETLQLLIKFCEISIYLWPQLDARLLKTIQQIGICSLSADKIPFFF